MVSYKTYNFHVKFEAMLHSTLWLNANWWLTGAYEIMNITQTTALWIWKYSWKKLCHNCTGLSNSLSHMHAILSDIHITYWSFNRTFYCYHIASMLWKNDYTIPKANVSNSAKVWAISQRNFTMSIFLLPDEIMSFYFHRSASYSVFSKLS